MQNFELSETALQKIIKDPIIFARVAQSLGISVFSLPRLLRDKDVRLTQAGVLEILRLEIGCDDTQLLAQTQMI